MTNLIKDINSKFPRNSKEKPIAPRDIDTKIDKPDQKPVSIIKDPSIKDPSIKDPSTFNPPIDDPSLPGDVKQPLDAKQPLSNDNGSSPSKLPGDRKPGVSDGENGKDSESGLYGSKQSIAGNKQGSAGLVGAGLGGPASLLEGSASGFAIAGLGGPASLLGGSASRRAGAGLGGAGSLLGSSALGLAGAGLGGPASLLGGSTLGLARTQSSGTVHGVSNAGGSLAGIAPSGLTSGTTPAIVGAAIGSLQITGGAAAQASAGSGSTEKQPPAENPLFAQYTQQTQSGLFGDNQKSFDRSDDLLGTSSLEPLDSLTNYGLLEPSLSPSSLTIGPIGNGVLAEPNLNPPSSFTYDPNLGVSMGAIAPLTGINSPGGTILPPDGLPSSIFAINSSGFGTFSIPVG